jgi:acyl-CoA thioesterase I
MKRILAIVVGIGVVVGALYFFVMRDGIRPASTIHNYPSQGKNIIAFGDSLIEGKGATKGNDMVSLLSQKLGVPIINEGVSGNTSAQGLARIQDVLTQNPKIVLVLFGGNDALQKVSPDQTFANIEQIIQKIHEKEAIVILLGVQDKLFRDSYREQFDALAEKYNTAYVPDILDGVINHSDLMSDFVHPNDKGYAKIVERIEPVLRNLLH